MGTWSSRLDERRYVARTSVTVSEIRSDIMYFIETASSYVSTPILIVIVWRTIHWEDKVVNKFSHVSCFPEVQYQCVRGADRNATLMSISKVVARRSGSIETPVRNREGVF